MTLPSHVPVLIVGGGPSGLAAAIELGRRAIPVLVLEPRATLDSLRPRAKTTSVRTMEHLRRWGIADNLRKAAPIPVDYAQDVVFVTGLFGKEITRFRNAFALTTERTDLFAETSQQAPQAVVEQCLRDYAATLPSVAFATGWQAVQVVDGPDEVHVTARHANGTEQLIAADWALGCDGGASTVRNAIGARLEGSSGALPNVNVTFRSRALEARTPCAHAIHYWVIGAERGGLMGRLDLDGTWWAIVQGVQGTEAHTDPVTLVQDLVGEPIDVEVLATDPWQARMLLADRYRGQRCFLVGDAAHLNPPWGGHGFNTCLGDAVNLAWKLAACLEGWGGERLLDSYEAERRPIAQRTIAAAGAQERFLASAFTAKALQADSDDGRALRALLAEQLQAKDPEFHSLGLVLGYDYPDSPVIAAESPAAFPQPVHEFVPSAHPGARLPHCWIDAESSIYDLLGKDFTLITVCGTESTQPIAAAAQAMGVRLSILALDDPSLTDRFDARYLLVRPDQHVAWRGATLDGAAKALKVAVGC